MSADRFVIPTGHFPHKIDNIALSSDDDRLLTTTFLRLAEMCHSLQGGESEILLLLTTCRNQWYTVNAIYVEARKWSAEGGKHTGYADALDHLRRGLARFTAPTLDCTREMQKAVDRALKRLEVAASYLAEFDKKFDLFFRRFDQVQKRIVDYAHSLNDKVAALEFDRGFARLGNGPPLHELRGPESPDKDLFVSKLTDWFAVVRPLTSLTRTYLDGIKELKTHGKSCEHYQQELDQEVIRWRAMGISCPSPTFSKNPQLLTSVAGSPQGRESFQKEMTLFIDFCQGMLACARSFLVDFLPAHKDLTERFPLQQPGKAATVTIGDREFERKGDMFVLVIDIRNSVPDRYRAPEIKIQLDRTIDSLTTEEHARSHTTFDDCRVVACDKLSSLIACILRLWTFFELRRNKNGIAGVRMGCVQGEMLFAFDGNLSDVRKSPALDSSLTTIARAARLMSLDSQRYKPEGIGVMHALKDWRDDPDLVFFDRTIYENLANSLRSQSRSIDIQDLKGIGPRECWVLKIQTLIEEEKKLELAK